MPAALQIDMAESDMAADIKRLGTTARAALAWADSPRTGQNLYSRLTLEWMCAAEGKRK